MRLTLTVDVHGPECGACPFQASMGWCSAFGQLVELTHADRFRLVAMRLPECIANAEETALREDWMRALDYAAGLAAERSASCDLAGTPLED